VRIILKLIFDRLDGWGGGGMDWNDLAKGKGQVAGSCECGDDLSGSIK
jgi:hypothetical protein